MTKMEAREKLSREVIEKLEGILEDAGFEIYRTGDNMNTITFPIEENEGKTTYGSIKFTLHKENYDLDKEIEEFEMVLEEKQKKEAEKAAAKKREEKKEAANEVNYAARKALKEKKRAALHEAAEAYRAQKESK